MVPIYLDELPESTIEITRIKGFEVMPGKYFYDYKNYLLIRKCNLDFDSKPFAIIQGPQFQPVLKSRDKPSKRFNLLEILNILARSYEAFKHKQQ